MNTVCYILNNKPLKYDDKINLSNFCSPITLLVILLLLVVYKVHIVAVVHLFTSCLCQPFESCTDLISQKMLNFCRLACHLHLQCNFAKFIHFISISRSYGFAFITNIYNSTRGIVTYKVLVV